MGQTINAIPTSGSCGRRRMPAPASPFMFDEVYAFGAGETLSQRYRLVIANGGWDAGQVEAAAEAWGA